MSDIYLDPAAGNPTVISIGGACYTLVGGSSKSPDTSAFDAGFSDCSSCPGPPVPCTDPGGLPASLTINFTFNDPEPGTAWTGLIEGGWPTYQGHVWPISNPSNLQDARLDVGPIGAGLCGWNLRMVYLFGSMFVYSMFRNSGVTPTGIYPPLVSGFDGANITALTLS